MLHNCLRLWQAGLCLVCLSISFSAGAQGYGDRLDLDYRLAPFYHGVASGDPLPDRVIIWTRITTDEDVVYGIWRVATDSLFTQNVIDGIFSTDESRDYTVKVDVTGLQPNSFYFYEFEALGKRSVRGRTKTSPAVAGQQYRMAVVNCSDMTTGYFNVYSRLCERNDFDVVYHIGDYIYEYESDHYISSGLNIRNVEPEHETISLVDYRTRYSWYRLDPELRKLHQQYPWIITWDDHETANDSWQFGATNHSNSTEGSWADRKSAGAQAFLEWLPIRESDGNPLDIYRSFTIGDLAKIYVIESRLTFRSRQDLVITLLPELDTESRGIMGPTQLNWFKNGLVNSNAKWQIMISPVTFSSLLLGVNPNFRSTDLWDGYPYQRKQIINHIFQNDIKNFVAISGDIHMAFAMDIPKNIDNFYGTNLYNPATGEGSIGVNFVGTSVSSGLCCKNVPLDNYLSINPHMKYLNVQKSGYNIIDITSERIMCDYYYVNSVQTPGDLSHFWGASSCVKDEEQHLSDCQGPSVFNGTSAPFAPCWPRAGGDTIVVSGLNVVAGEIVGVHPVPSADAIGVQFYIQSSDALQLTLTDLSGKTVMRERLGWLEYGLHYRNIVIQSLASGTYILTLSNKSGDVVASRKVIRQ